MKTFLLSILALICLSEINAQELIPYFDKQKQLWGFQNKDSKQIVIQPEFTDAVEWWKDFGIVMINGKYGLIDRNGKKVSPFILDYLAVEHCEECRKDELMGFYYYGYDYSMERKFYVNEKCDCIPYSYYPCPPMVKMDTSGISEPLRYIQRAEFHYHQGNIDKSFLYADKAILADTNDAASRFWKASHMADGYDIYISEDPEILGSNLESEYSSYQNEFHKKSNTLENALVSDKKDKITQEEYDAEMKLLYHQDSIDFAWYTAKQKTIDSLRVFYDKWQDQTWNYWNALYDTTYHLQEYYDGALRHQVKNSPIYLSTLAGKYAIDGLPKSEKKKIKKEIIANTPRYNRKSDMAVMLNGGWALFPYQKLEVNLTYGYSDFVFKNVFPLMVGAGIGYEQGLDLKLETYKAMFFIQPIGPIHGALNLMYVRNAGSGGIGVRPEFGFSFSALTILYGFNFVSDTKFPDARGNMVGFRLNLPIWRMNDFKKTWGNNLYRSY